MKKVQIKLTIMISIKQLLFANLNLNLDFVSFIKIAMDQM